MRSNTRFAIHTLAAAAIAAFGATGAAAADAYLKIGDIKGESASADTHKDWIEIDSYQWGQARGVQGGVSVASGDVSGDSAGAASGLPTGKRQHKPMTITKEMDKATPKLSMATLASPPETGSISFRGTLQGCAAGMHHPSATLATAYYKYELRDVIITSCATGGGGGGGSALPMEEISMNYGKINVTPVPADQQESGKWKPAGWDLGKDKGNR